MGVIAAIKAITRKTINGAKVTIAKIDLGGGDVREGPYYTPAGFESQPLPNDRAAGIAQQEAGGVGVVGTIDTKNEDITGPGESRQYARNASGDIVGQIYARNNGDLILNNDAGFILLEAGGNINLNGVIITPSGEILAPSTIAAAGAVSAPDMIFDGKSSKDHTHEYIDTVSGTGPVTKETEPPS